MRRPLLQRTTTQSRPFIEFEPGSRRHRLPPAIRGPPEHIQTLIDNEAKQKHRSMFIIVVGNKSPEEIVYMLSKSVAKSPPSVLWCSSDKFELSSRKIRLAAQYRCLIRDGILDEDNVDSPLFFAQSEKITYCLYRKSDNVLGNTFGMCVLQDVEQLNSTLLARTVETVEGGGLVILLLRSLSSLSSLYSLAMVHERFRTETHLSEQFLLSTASCKGCVVMDNEFNIFPISSQIKNLQPVSISEDPVGISDKENELKALKDQYHDQYPVGPLIEKCCTIDQGKALVTFLDSILDKALRSNIALIASRGCGKSVALGLAIAGAVAAGYSNIFVAAPSLHNLRTLTEFIIKGFDLMEYKEHLHYDLERIFTDFQKKVMLQINVYKEHRQTIRFMTASNQYEPSGAEFIVMGEGEVVPWQKLREADLLVIDEAAAIPLPNLKYLLEGPYLVFLSSTVYGYEGNGHSLPSEFLGRYNMKKIELKESVRYAPGDPIASLFRLDVGSSQYIKY